ncbi:Hypothetical protein, putative [Bodo saltans]|uniref:Uncharacterized protein n=1 Tax=Bodo saltans TaxID=75058 RepID=A0A0S4JA96_BODSA|nr:Hypothetical protein, putative [Bodo saltans]|eukprot:CUG88479.1 Hypothetical protein, putative [Bodo saltans]
MFPRNVGYEPPHQLSPIVTAILATSTAASPPVERLPRERYDRVSSPFAAKRLTHNTMFLNREDQDGDVPIHIEQSDITVDDTLQLGWKFPRATTDATVGTTGFEHQNGHSPHEQRWGGRSESAPQSAVSRSKWEAVVVHPTNHMAQTLVTPAATAPSSVTTLPMLHDVSSVTIPLSSVEAVSFVDAEAWDSGDDDDNRTITAAERGEMAPHGTSEIIEEVNADVHRNAHLTGDATAPLRRLGLPPRSPPPSHSVSLARAVSDSMCNTDADQMSGQQDLLGKIGVASTPSSVSPVSDTTDGSPIRRHYEQSSHVYSSDDDTAPGATAAKAHDQSFEAEVLSRRLANLRAEVDHMCFAVFLEASTSPAKESVDHAQHHYAYRTHQAPPSPLAHTLPPGRRVAAPRETTAKRYESPERMASSSLPTSTTQRSKKTHVVSRPAHITTTTAAVVGRTETPKPSQPRAAVKAAERVNAMKVEHPPSPLPQHDTLLAPHVAASKLFPYRSTSATDESFRIPLGGTTLLQPPAYDDDDEDQYPRSLDDVAFFSSYAKTRMVSTQSTMSAGTFQQDPTVTADSAVGMLSTSSPAVVVVRQPLATSKTFAAKKRRNGEIRQNLVDVIPIERVKYNTATHRFPPQVDSSVPLPAVAATIETPKANSVKIVAKPHALISSTVPPTERRAEASNSATHSEEFLWTPVKRQEGPSPKKPHQQQQVLSPLQQQHQKLRKHTKNHQHITTTAPSHTPSPNNNAAAFDSPRGRNNLQRPNTSSGSNTNTTQSKPMTTFLETSPPHHNASFTNEEQQFVQFPSSTRREESPGMHSANSSITFAERSLSQHSVAAASTTTSTRVQEAPPEQFVEHTNKPHIPSTQHVTSETVDNTASVVLHDVAPAQIADAMAASNLSASSEIQFELFSSDDETSCDHAKQEDA